MALPKWLDSLSMDQRLLYLKRQLTAYFGVVLLRVEPRAKPYTLARHRNDVPGLPNDHVLELDGNPNFTKPRCQEDHLLRDAP